MIREKDVIRMKIPYPTINDELAAAAHMYVCKSAKGTVREFVKCQTFKPYMITNNTIQHYCDESPDISRNPFRRLTRIDCDKIFCTYQLEYDWALRTTNRVDVCQDLYEHIIKELEKDGYDIIELNERELMQLNPLVRKMQ